MAPFSRRRPNGESETAGMFLDSAAAAGKSSIPNFDRGQKPGGGYGERTDILDEQGIDKDAIVQCKDEVTGEWYDHGPAHIFNVGQIDRLIQEGEARFKPIESQEQDDN